MNETDEEFQKVDQILAGALEQFNENGVSPYVYGMALMEIGIADLAKVGEDEATIVEQARQITSRVLPIVKHSS